MKRRRLESREIPTVPTVSVDPRTLLPNPTRDFDFDPIDDELVEDVRRSIVDHGYWGGVVCRRNQHGQLEIAGGQVRVCAAIAAGLEEIDVYVKQLTDLDMLVFPAQMNIQLGRQKHSWLYGTVQGLLDIMLQAMEDDEPGELFADHRILERMRQSAMKRRPIVLTRYILERLQPTIVTEAHVQEAIKTLQDCGEFGDPLLAPS